MHRNRLLVSRRSTFGVACTALATVSLLGCSSDSAPTPRDGGAGRTGLADGSAEGAAMCASPGAPTPGAVDVHCSLPDGGATVQPTRAASCQPDVGAPTDGGNDQSCAYGATMFGQESDDDDCKYHLRWSSSPICEGSSGVVVTMVMTNKTDGSPATGAMTEAEAFTTTPGDWDAASFCDTMSTHPSPSGGLAPLTEGPAGTYTGTVAFDQSGQWTLRFHFRHDCVDVFRDSPHGHAAYHVTVP